MPKKTPGTSSGNHMRPLTPTTTSTAETCINIVCCLPAEYCCVGCIHCYDKAAQIDCVKLPERLAFMESHAFQGIMEVFFMVGWGVWIVHIGLPVLGWVFVVFAFVPSWPYAVYDAFMGDAKRCAIAFVGLRHLHHYGELAESPEMELVEAITGKIPMMLVIAVATAGGTDILVSGEQENDVLRAVTILYVMYSGVTISKAAYVCLDATRSKIVRAKSTRRSSGHVNEFANRFLTCENCVALMGEIIEASLFRVYAAFVHAIDAVSVVYVVGAVGASHSHSSFCIWMLVLWLLCGLFPAMVKPPPMPTLEPPIPEKGLPALLHRLVVSLLLTASPPIEYMPFLTRQGQYCWAISVLFRSAWILAACSCTPESTHLAVGPFEFVTFVFVGIGNTTFLVIFLLAYLDGYDEVADDFEAARYEDLHKALLDSVSGEGGVGSEGLCKWKSSTGVGSRSMSQTPPTRRSVNTERSFQLDADKMAEDNESDAPVYAQPPPQQSTISLMDDVTQKMPPLTRMDTRPDTDRDTLVMSQTPLGTVVASAPNALQTVPPKADVLVVHNKQPASAESIPPAPTAVGQPATRSTFSNVARTTAYVPPLDDGHTSHVVVDEASPARNGPWWSCHCPQPSNRRRGTR